MLAMKIQTGEGAKKKELTWFFSFAIIHMFLWCEWSLLDTPFICLEALLYLLVHLVLACYFQQNIYLFKVIIWFDLVYDFLASIGQQDFEFLKILARLSSMLSKRCSLLQILQILLKSPKFYLTLQTIYGHIFAQELSRIMDWQVARIEGKKLLFHVIDLLLMLSGCFWACISSLLKIFPLGCFSERF